ncbi:hypothetical protein N7414_27055 [Pseudomonas sp. GD04087]|uniref:hypothetical protein n=1 Tax=unclassified Pseudomonas TaxID=196821 RepID=UPI00244851F8|nr:MULTISPECIES: hypothetical protein [unclassified Pseudomonas]MDH0292795.1 hypothetical protein [Pseudomonas sp. GD04087]MDH1051345.1 hypothetical protein [Pseudomonas sp. GD03903]MDH2003156.1 hypothetical protein [Pseudomonas sp. GD03691]
MGGLVDFASVLIKLVIILLVALMSGTLLVLPDTAMELAPTMLLLVVPLFVLTIVLDLMGASQRSSELGGVLKVLRQPRRS